VNKLLCGKSRVKDRPNDVRYREEHKKIVVINKRESGMGGNRRSEDDNQTG
jgi:hypothetical protein